MVHPYNNGSYDIHSIAIESLYTKHDVKSHWSDMPDASLLDRIGKPPCFYMAIDCNAKSKDAEILQSYYADGVRSFVLENSSDNLHDNVDFESLFDKIDISALQLNIRGIDAITLASDFIKFCKVKSSFAARLDIGLSIEMLQKAHEDGNRDFIDLLQTINFPETVVAIDGLEHENRGNTEVEQIAYIIAEAVEYLKVIEKIDNGWLQYANRLRLIVGFNQNLYVNIAKIRALRQIWGFIAANCLGQVNNLPQIYGIVSPFTLTRSDIANNILRLTGACCAALLADIEHIELPNFTAAFSNVDQEAALGRRLSFTIPLVAYHEANIGRIKDPIAGSYMIESLTDQLAEKGYALFQQIEKNGGYRKFCRSGKKIAKQRKNIEKRRKLIAKRDKIIVGVNEFATQNESMAQMRDMINKYPISFEDSDTKNHFVLPSHDFDLLRQRVENLKIAKKISDCVLIAPKKIARPAFILVGNLLACAGLTCEIKELNENAIKNRIVIFYDKQNDATKKKNVILNNICKFKPKSVFYIMASDKIIASRRAIVNCYALDKLNIVDLLNDIISSMEK